MNKRANQQGFTLIELLLAMTLFSFMMVIISIGVIKVMQIYQSGVSARRTQQAARLAMEDMTREVRNGKFIPNDPEGVGIGVLCVIGSKPVKFRQVTNADGKSELIKTSGGSDCDNVPDSPAEKLIETGTANNSLEVRGFITKPIYDENDPNLVRSVSITLLISTGDDELIDGTTCLPGPGAPYCSTTKYTNTVSLRGQ